MSSTKKTCFIVAISSTLLIVAAVLFSKINVNTPGNENTPDNELTLMVWLPLNQTVLVLKSTSTEDLAMAENRLVAMDHDYFVVSEIPSRTQIKIDVDVLKNGEFGDREVVIFPSAGPSVHNLLRESQNNAFVSIVNTYNRSLLLQSLNQ